MLYRRTRRCVYRMEAGLGWNVTRISWSFVVCSTAAEICGHVTTYAPVCLHEVGCKEGASALWTSRRNRGLDCGGFAAERRSIFKRRFLFSYCLYGCETWSLTIREEHKPRVFKKSLLRTVFRLRDGVTGGWRKLHNEKRHNLYSTPSIIRIIMSRRIRWVERVAWMGRRGMCISYW
jgi:hypothetical protein